ncbi:PREDICTED: nucleoside diphosphate kinase 6-like isoform X2 [Priapulus caudatus]|nr:PREDICTED: nucleoside diphosphate kinase 6-like isoform X2 [Priapulus caudatus]
MLTLSQADAESFYGEHKGKFFFPELIAFMTSGPIFAHVLARDNAIKEWRALMGPTKPSQARKDAPQTLRAQFGTEDTFNAVHGSDSPMSAAREVGFYFPDFNVDEWFVKQEPAFAKGEVSFDEKTCIHVPK